jgi:hypothetical protein
MTQSNKNKNKPSQLSLNFSTEIQSVEAKRPVGVVSHFISREAITIRKEALERVTRDGIFSVSLNKKA